MNAITFRDNDGLYELTGYEQDGTAWLNLEKVARHLGFTTVATSGNEIESPDISG